MKYNAKYWKEKIESLSKCINEHKISSVIVFVVIGISIFLIYGYVNNLVGFILFTMYTIGYYILMFNATRKSFWICLKIIGGIVIGIILLYIIGFEVLNFSKIFVGNQKDMIGVYGSIFAGLISASIGAIAAIYGSNAGAKKSYQGAMDAVTKQISNEKDKLLNEEKQDSKKAQNLIEYFLKDEIRYNFHRLSKFKEENLETILNIFKSNNKNWSYSYFDNALTENFKFDEFNAIKYKYFKFMNHELIDIYKMFKLLDLNGSFTKLTDKEKDDVKNTYLKYYEEYYGRYIKQEPK